MLLFVIIRIEVGTVVGSNVGMIMIVGIGFGICGLERALNEKLEIRSGQTLDKMSAAPLRSHSDPPFDSRIGLSRLRERFNNRI